MNKLADYDGPILEIDKLSISFFTRLREIPAVMDFSVSVQPGEAVHRLDAAAVLHRQGGEEFDHLVAPGAGTRDSARLLGGSGNGEKGQGEDALEQGQEAGHAVSPAATLARRLACLRRNPRRCAPKVHTKPAVITHRLYSGHLSEGLRTTEKVENQGPSCPGVSGP